MKYDPGPVGLLIEQFYEGALSDDGWTEALETAARLMGSPQALIMVRDHSLNQFRINENFGVPAEVTAEYNDYYHQHDPAHGVADSVPLGQWYHDRQHVGEHAMRRSLFYQDFMRRRGYSSVIANRVSLDGNIESLLSLQRLADQPAYTDAELALLLPVIPHLRRAIRIRTQLESAAAGAAVGKRVFDHLQLPLMVVEPTGRPVMVNQRADDVMRRWPVLTVQGGKLQLRGRADAQLQKMLRGAFGVDTPAIAGAMQVWNETHEAMLQIVVAPLPARQASTHGWGRPLALVLLNDPEVAASPPERVLQQMYELTAAEARVAVAIGRGSSPDEIARQLAITLFTVRSHLKAIYSKTGARRQSDLVRMLSAVLVVSPKA